MQKYIIGTYDGGTAVKADYADAVYVDVEDGIDGYCLEVDLFPAADVDNSTTFILAVGIKTKEVAYEMLKKLIGAISELSVSSRYYAVEVDAEFVRLI